MTAACQQRDGNVRARCAQRDANVTAACRHRTRVPSRPDPTTRSPSSSVAPRDDDESRNQNSVPSQDQQETPMNAMFRQGDVLITATADTPNDLRPVKRDQGRVILAYGEVTGHAHAILDPAAELFTIGDMDEMDGRFLRVDAEVLLRHEEHDTITLPPGDYLVRRQREYASADMDPIYVAD